MRDCKFPLCLQDRISGNLEPGRVEMQRKSGPICDAELGAWLARVECQARGPDLSWRKRRFWDATQIVAGLDEGLKTMKVGGLRRLYIPSNLSFPKGLPSGPGRYVIMYRPSLESTPAGPFATPVLASRAPCACNACSCGIATLKKGISRCCLIGPAAEHGSACGMLVLKGSNLPLLLILTCSARVCSPEVVPIEADTRWM